MLPSRTASLLSSVLVFVVLGAAACGYDVHVNAPAASDTTSKASGDSGGGTFQRATLTVTVVVVPEDSAVASEVGISSGAVAQCAVTIQRSGSGGSRQSETTDASGGVTFTNLVPGTYTVSAARVLSSAESARLDSADADVNAFGGGATVNVTAPGANVSVEVVAGRRGSLVISEIFAAIPPIQGGAFTNYYYGQFIEVYNNADTTIYLDGKIIGIGEVWVRDYPTPRSCADMARWRDDPEGIWARYFDAFPGNGRDYPLAPGRAAVIAVDAIDHRAVLPGMLDLSGSRFELRGSNDIDNPGVPDMVDVGLAEYGAGVLGHGLEFDAGPSVFVASPVNVAALPHDNLPAADPVHVRIPASAILDVFTTTYTPSEEAATAVEFGPLCPQIVNVRFDRQYASLYDRLAIQSMTRKVFTTLPDGRVILLRTRSSANDFEIAPPTPGKVP